MQLIDIVTKYIMRPQTEVQYSRHTQYKRIIENRSNKKSPLTLCSHSPELHYQSTAKPGKGWQLLE